MRIILGKTLSDGSVQAKSYSLLKRQGVQEETYFIPEKSNEDARYSEAAKKDSMLDKERVSSGVFYDNKMSLQIEVKYMITILDIDIKIDRPVSDGTELVIMTPHRIVAKFKLPSTVTECKLDFNDLPLHETEYGEALEGGIIIFRDNGNVYPIITADPVADYGVSVAVIGNTKTDSLLTVSLHTAPIK